MIILFIKDYFLTMYIQGSSDVIYVKKKVFEIFI